MTHLESIAITVDKLLANKNPQHAHFCPEHLGYWECEDVSCKDVHRLECDGCLDLISSLEGEQAKREELTGW
jgi:hypothetical protein